MSKKATGTKEWAVETVNCVTGCGHFCRYCFARYNAVKRYKWIASNEDWPNEKIRQHDVDKRRRKINGVVLFPSTHDVTPDNFDACLIVIGKLVIAKNDVLIVSKPHLECITKLCDALAKYKKQVMFRFTIGAIDSDILKYWEPGAPDFDERLACLQHAQEQGYRTSISIEPILDFYGLGDLIEKIDPFVTDTIWLGKMNNIKSRVEIVTDEDREMVAKLEAGQTDDMVKSLYYRFRSEPKIRWKDSIKKIVGIDLNEESGLDK